MIVLTMIVPNLAISFSTLITIVTSERLHTWQNLLLWGVPYVIMYTSVIQITFCTCSDELSLGVMIIIFICFASTFYSMKRLE